METETAKLHETMEVFSNIIQAVAFTPNEIALFYVLLSSWNAARRPAVIEQWASVTCQASGLTNKTLLSARNKLVQRGVLYFHKEGNRGVPQYSFNALHDLPNPFTSHLQAPRESKRESKRTVSGRVSGNSYQGKDKEKEEAKAGRPAAAPISETNSSTLKFVEEDDSPPPRTTTVALPSLEDLMRYSRSLPMVCTEQCVQRFFDDMESCGWIDAKHRPIANWQASLRAYASRWNQNEQARAMQKNQPKPQTRTLAPSSQNYVKSL